MDERHEKDTNNHIVKKARGPEASRRGGARAAHRDVGVAHDSQPIRLVHEFVHREVLDLQARRE